MNENIQIIRRLASRLPNSGQRRLVLLTGARQTGKTTLAKAIYPDLRYVNLDAPENREAVRVIMSAAWSRDIGPAILDEAQKEPVVFEKVKYAYDDGGLSFTVLLGSSQVLTLKRIRETLAGRISIYEMWPLMMSEIFGHTAVTTSLPIVDRLFTDTGCDAIFENQPQILLAEEDDCRRRAEDYLLQWGGMPALLPLSDADRHQWLKDYGYTYLERDVADLARLDDLMPFRKFQRLTALRSGCLLNYSELARDTGVSVDTARRYLEYLRISYQAVLLQPYHVNLTSMVVKTPKIYWLDIGIVRQLMGIQKTVTGEIYETMIVGELIKWMKTGDKDGEIYFYRTRSGLEVDVIIDTPFGVIGVEIKSRQNLAAKDTTGLKEIAKSLGSRWRGGLIVYPGNRLYPIEAPQIWAVPSRRLFA
ncbi:MAG: ATP-binding protein [Desulfatirhabdiaceae bacterium]